MTQEAFGQEFDWFFFFSALIYPYLSRKWSDTFTYKIMKDLSEFPQEM